jgi:succinoglycan biosynthesis transport protein ExoP
MLTNRSSSPLTSASKIPFIRPEYLPMSIARALWKGKFIVALVWVAVTVASFVYVSKLPAIYYAEAFILVEAPKISAQYAPSLVNTTLQDRLATLTRQILSSAKLEQVAEDFKIWGKHPVPESVTNSIRDSIQLNVERGWSGDQPGALRVGFEGPNARMCAGIANRIAGFFVEENSKAREDQAQETMAFLNTQLRETKEKLDREESAISRYKVEHNGEMPQQEGVLMGMLSRLQGEAQANQDAIGRAGETKLSLEDSLRQAEATVHAMETGAAAPETSAPVDTPAKPPAPPRQSEVMQAELEQLRLRYSEQHPDIRKLKEQIAIARQAEAAEDRQALARMASVRAPEKPAGAAPSKPSPAETIELLRARDRVAGIKRQVAAAEKDLAARTADQQRIERDLAQYQARVNQLPLREQAIADLMRDYDITKATYQSLLSKRMTADVGTNLERNQKSERFIILEAAQVPTTPRRPNRRTMRLVGCGLGLLLGLAVAFANELRRNVVLGPWEFSPQLPILGSLPNIVIERCNEGSKPFWRPKLRLVAWSSAALSLLALGWYVAAKRF